MKTWSLKTAAEWTNYIMNHTPILNLNRDVDPFTLAYIECALWSSTDDDGDPLDAHYNWTHLADETLRKMIADCAKFQKEQSKDLCVSVSQNATEGGHCFWLSRNGHGSGFFDSEHFANDTRDKLQTAARNFGECDLYIGDDGKIYC